MFTLDGLNHLLERQSQVADAEGRGSRDRSRVAVVRLTLSAFRCYDYRRLDLSPASVVLTGPNGSGKTTMLEALSLLAPGRGLRRARLEEMKRLSGLSDRAPGPWAVAARVRTPSGEIDVGTGLSADPASLARERRQVRIDAQPARAHAALASIIAVSWLTPEMDRLFAEGAAARRRFLDRLVSTLDPDHVRRVNAYDAAMQERARLLRRGNADLGWLAALEETMAARAVAVAAARLDHAERLNLEARAHCAFPGATLAVDGTVEGWLADGQTALAAECRLREALAEARSADAEAGGAGVGPHRSDLLVHHLGSGRPARICSTGEQKALLIAIVLAGARLQKAERGTAPLLLLDEVAAHLDARHRTALFAEIASLDAQAWFTGTDTSVFAPLGDSVQFVLLGQEPSGGGHSAAQTR